MVLWSGTWVVIITLFVTVRLNPDANKYVRAHEEKVDHTRAATQLS